MAELIDVDDALRKFLDAAGGEGLVLGGVDAGDLFSALYPISAAEPARPKGHFYPGFTAEESHAENVRVYGDAALTGAEKLAAQFHNTYERLAPQFGYETRADTKTFDYASNNGRLMVAVCTEILASFEASKRRLVEFYATPQPSAKPAASTGIELFLCQNNGGEGGAPASWGCYYGREMFLNCASPLEAVTRAIRKLGWHDGAKPAANAGLSDAAGMAAEIRALMLKGEMARAMCLLQQLQDALASTPAPVRAVAPEAVTRDAARYRWLRDRTNWDVLPVDKGDDLAEWKCLFDSPYGMRHEADDNLDQAIDSAMASAPPAAQGAPVMATPSDAEIAAHVAELLHRAGWLSVNDAQHEGLAAAVPGLQAVLSARATQ